MEWLRMNLQFKSKMMRKSPSISHRIVISTTGIVPKSIHDSLKILDLNKYKYIELQKAVILSTSHIVRKFISSD